MLNAEGNDRFVQTLTDKNIIDRLQDWEAEKSKDAMFLTLTNSLRQVESILSFLAASRSSNLNLHLCAGEGLSKLFFVFDRIKYKRLWPRYLADMQSLQIEHPDTWHELEQGSISVTKRKVGTQHNIK